MDTKYLRNCLWLTAPPLLFNLAFMGLLPPAFSAAVFERDIPAAVAVPENILRVMLFALPVLMPLRVDTPRRRAGMAFYLTGIALYFLAWLPLMVMPESSWSTSLLGFMAPAYTPLLWLAGIALLGDTLFLRVPYRWWFYLLLTALFLAFHNTHVWLVYARLRGAG